MRIVLAVALCFVVGIKAVPVRADTADICAKVGNDDRIYHYDRALRQGFVRAYKRLFPGAKGVESDAMMRDQAFFRCMDGRLVACFVGANLPCAKINAARINAGADAFCRANPGEGAVPMSASGHDALFQFHCVKGHAEVGDAVWTLDERGFAKEIWTPLD